MSFKVWRRGKEISFPEILATNAHYIRSSGTMHYVPGCKHVTFMDVSYGPERRFVLPVV